MKHLPLLFVLLVPLVAHADADTLFDTVSLAAQSELEVDNDRIEAMLIAEREGADPAKLADTVNRDMDWALRQLQPVQAINASTPTYQTFPVYQQGRISGWRVRQTLKLESADVPLMSDMLGKLQSRLGLQGINFILSPERRRSVEEKLITEALANFTARAQMVAQQLGRGGYRLVNMQVNTGGGPRPPVAQMAMMRAEAMVAAPRMEGGSSQVQVSVTGTIQLKD